MATQKGRNWSSGDIVTAANLSSIERGVSEVAEEYTPTTWANGNTVTAAGLNNIEQGIVNAGGGSSDFSTAQVTLNPALGKPIEIAVPYINDWRDQLMPLNEPIQQNDTIIVPLYHGSVVAMLTSIGSISISGDIENVDEGVYIITGNCTITIS